MEGPSVDKCNTTQSITHQPALQDERIFAVVSPIDNIVDHGELPMLGLQQRFVAVDPTSILHAPAIRPTSLSSSPNLPNERIVSLTSESEAVPYVPIRRPAVQSSFQATTEEAEVAPKPVTRTEEPISTPLSATKCPPCQSTGVSQALAEPHIQSDSRPDRESEGTSSIDAVPDTMYLTVLDEPLAVYDIYHAFIEDASGAVAKEACQSVSDVPFENPVVKADEEPSTSYLPPPPAPPSRPSPIYASTGPSVLASEVGLEAPLTVTTTKRMAKRQPERELHHFDRGPTADLAPNPVNSANLAHQETHDSLGVNGRIPQTSTALSVTIEQGRKFSTAAPGIVAPPPQLVPRSHKPTEAVQKPRKKMHNYPPERQYPPAPAYPARDTPRWTRPDIHTPPPRPQAAPTQKKRKFLGLCPKAILRPPLGNQHLRLGIVEHNLS